MLLFFYSFPLACQMYKFGTNVHTNTDLIELSVFLSGLYNINIIVYTLQK